MCGREYDSYMYTTRVLFSGQPRVARRASREREEIMRKRSVIIYLAAEVISTLAENFTKKKEEKKMLKE